MLMCIQNFVNFFPLVLKILSGNKILTSIKGHNSVANLRNLTLYNLEPNSGSITSVGEERANLSAVVYL